eukprot:UN16301
MSTFLKKNVLRVEGFGVCLGPLTFSVHIFQGKSNFKIGDPKTPFSNFLKHWENKKSHIFTIDN